MSSFRIKYQVENHQRGIIKSGEIIVRNCYSSSEAQFKLERKTKRDHKDFFKLVVISCKAQETIADFLAGFGLKK